jgi:hypothetical protein
MPVARHRARAPAMLRPWVVVRERSCGMVDCQHHEQRRHPWSPRRQRERRDHVEAHRQPQVCRVVTFADHRLDVEDGAREVEELPGRQHRGPAQIRTTTRVIGHDRHERRPDDRGDPGQQVTLPAVGGCPDADPQGQHEEGRPTQQAGIGQRRGQPESSGEGGIHLDRTQVSDLAARLEPEARGVEGEVAREPKRRQQQVDPARARSKGAEEQRADEHRPGSVLGRNPAGRTSAATGAGRR